MFYGYYAPFQKKSYIYCKLGHTHSGTPLHISPEIGVHYNVHQKLTYIFADMTHILCLRAIIPLLKNVTYVLADMTYML